MEIDRYRTLMKLSIIMTVYRAKPYIRRHLGQLLTHDLSDVQLIVVVSEDKKPDNSAQICKELLNGSENTQIIIQPDEGLSIARNTGLKAATGDYVYFMDSDDVLLEEGLTELKDTLLSTQTDVLVGKFVLFQSKGIGVWPDYTFPTVKSHNEARKLIYGSLPDSIWNVWRYVCRREFLLQHEIFFVPNLICEDVEWTPRMLDAAKSIGFIEAPLYSYYYNHSLQLSKRISPKRTLDINQTVLDGIVKFKDRPYGEALCRRLIRESFYSISDYCRFPAAERKMLRRAINACERHYHLSSDRRIWLYMKTRPVIPIYIWSAALLAAKTIRGLMKRQLGANKAWRT